MRLKACTFDRQQVEIAPTNQRKNRTGVSQSNTMVPEKFQWPIRDVAA
jgi:hypothetical protein